MDLPRADILSLVKKSRKATAALARALTEKVPSEEAVAAALAQGAVLADVEWVEKSKRPLDSDTRKDIWDRLFEVGSPALFARVLSADPLSPSLGTALLNRAAASASGDLVRLLLEHGAKPNALGPPPAYREKEWSRQTSLATAVQAGNDDALDVLLAAGASPHDAYMAPAEKPQFDYNARTPLHQVKTPHAVHALVARGVSVDAQDAAGRSPLEIVYAQASGANALALPATLALVDALLDAGASTDIRRPTTAPSSGSHRDRWHALVHVANARMRPDTGAALVRQLLARGVSWPEGVVPQTPASAAWLIEQGASLDVPTHGRRWLRHWLTSHAGYPIDAKALKQLGIDLSSRYPDGMTPFLLALRQGDEENLNALLTAGADPEQGPPADPQSRRPWKSVIKDVCKEYSNENNELTEALWELADAPHIKADVLAHALDTSMTDSASPPRRGARL